MRRGRSGAEIHGLGRRGLSSAGATGSRPNTGRGGRGQDGPRSGRREEVWRARVRLGSRAACAAAPLPAAPQSAQCALPVPAACSSSSSRFLLRSRSPMARPAGSAGPSTAAPPPAAAHGRCALLGRWSGKRAPAPPAGPRPHQPRPSRLPAPPSARPVCPPAPRLRSHSGSQANASTRGDGPERGVWNRSPWPQIKSCLSTC